MTKSSILEGIRVFFCLLPFAVALGACKDREAQAAPAAAGGFAVVELFSSEGCNSCPPADEVLADWAKKGDPRVFPLSFHVDYWDSPAWTDRFASEAFTDRQQAYAKSFGTNSLYTPQMVVGGTEAFVGSDASRSRAAVARALGKAPEAALTVGAEPGDGGAVRVRFHADKLPKGNYAVRVALVERALVSRVTGGENAGKTLPHENVVRAFTSVPLRAADGAATLTVPPAVDRSKAEIIAFIQS